MATIESIRDQNGTHPIRDDSKVAKTGDTMTGTLTLQSADLDQSTTPESAVYGDRIVLQDANGNVMGFIRIQQLTNGTNALDIRAQREISGTNHYNQLILGIDNQGWPTVTVSVPDVWADAILTPTLWQSLTNSSAFSGTIYYRKYGKWVSLVSDPLTLASALSSASGVAIGTIPAGYRPGKDIFAPFASTYLTGLFKVGTDGVITVYKDRATSSMTTSMSFYLSTMYLTN